MILVSVRQSGAHILSIKVEGHADYAESGSDIICAGVSALMQALQIGIVEVVGTSGALVKKIPERGLMEVSVAGPSDDKTEVLFRTIYASLEGIQSTYPGYLEISEV